MYKFSRGFIFANGLHLDLACTYFREWTVSSKFACINFRDSSIGKSYLQEWDAVLKGICNINFRECEFANFTHFAWIYFHLKEFGLIPFIENNVFLSTFRHRDVIYQDGDKFVIFRPNYEVNTSIFHIKYIYSDSCEL